MTSTETLITPRWGLGDAVGGWVVAQVLSLAFGAFLLGVTGWRGDAPIWGLAVLQLPLWSVMVGTVVVAGITKGNGPRRDFLIGQRWWDAPVGLLVGVVMQVVVGFLYLVLSRAGMDTSGTRETADRLTEAAGDRLWGWVIFALIVGVGAPVAEELFYRGLLQRALLKRGLGVGAAVVVTSLIFAVVHMQPVSVPGLALFAVVLGLMVERTGRLGGAIWAHVGFNMTTVVAMYASTFGG